MWPSPASQLMKQPANFARTAVVQDCVEFFWTVFFFLGRTLP
jgi:hypothetical protein